MNAKMRIGLPAILAAAAFSSMVTTSALAAGQNYDNQLQRWTMQRVAENFNAPLRGTYEFNEVVKFTTKKHITSQMPMLDVLRFERKIKFFRSVGLLSEASL